MSNTRSKLIILGGSGHGKVVAEIAVLSNLYSEIYFVDDFSDKLEINGIPIIGTSVILPEYKESTDIIVAIGDNSIRKEKINWLIENEYSLTSLIHPNAIVSKTAKIKNGTVVLGGAIINASASVGIGVIVNSNSIVEHDCKIENFVHISPGVTMGGNVKIGTESWLGANSTLINNITIFPKTIIGAGAVVIRDIDKKGTYVGVPARKVGNNN